MRRKSGPCCFFAPDKLASARYAVNAVAWTFGGCVPPANEGAKNDKTG
jgi:hypothetical protein